LFNLRLHIFKITGNGEGVTFFTKKWINGIYLEKKEIQIKINQFGTIKNSLNNKVTILFIVDFFSSDVQF